MLLLGVLFMLVGFIGFYSYLIINYKINIIMVLISVLGISIVLYDKIKL